MLWKLSLLIQVNIEEYSVGMSVGSVFPVKQ